MRFVVVLLVLVFALSSGASTSRGAEDCTGSITRMQACLPFVSNQISIPSSDCCKALLFVHLNSPVCLCELLGASPSAASNGINVTTALLLPQICKVHTDPARCPSLLAGAPEPSSASDATVPPQSSSTEDVYFAAGHGGSALLLLHLLAFIVLF